MDLGIVTHDGGIKTERFHAPLQISLPVGTAQRQPFTQRGFIDLNNANARGFQVCHFVTQRKSNLFGDGFTADVFARE